MMNMTDALRRSHAGQLTAATLSVLALGGCAISAMPPQAEMPMGPVAEVHSQFDCRSEPSSWLPDTETPTADPSIPVPGTVPENFDAIAAVRCSLEFEHASARGGDGGVVWRVERFEGDLAPLLEALAEADDAPPPGELLCTADFEIVPALWLEGRAGGFAPVHYPRDACGKTKPAVENALSKLQVTKVDRIPDPRQSPPEMLPSPR